MRRSAVVALAGVLLLTGCTTASASSVTSAAPRPTSAASGSPSPSLTAAGGYRPLPLDAYRFSDEQTQVYVQAVQLLRIPCLARYGFTPYPDPPSPPQDLGDGAYVTEQGYGSGDVVTPAQRAHDDAMKKFDEEYERNPPSAAYLLVDQGTEKRDGITPPPSASDKTVNGKKVYPTGCTGWAQDQISTKDRSSGQPRELRPIYDAAWAAYEADPALAELQAQWSSCVRGKGFTFAKPEEAPYGPPPELRPDAQGRVKVSPPEELPAQVEQAIARADLACRAQTSYEDKNHELQAKHQRVLIEQNAAVLAELQKNLADELRAAAAVVAGAAPTPTPSR